MIHQGVARVIAGSQTLERLVARLSRRGIGGRAVTSLGFHVGRTLARRGGDLRRVGVTDGDLKIHLTLDEPLFRLIYFHGTHERETSDLLGRLARPGQTWVDIGANVGVFTLLLGKRVGAGGRVIAYEPNPRMGDLLLRSIDDNGMGQIDLRRAAVGAEAGAATLNVPADPERAPGGSGRASLVGLDNVSDTVGVEVPVVRLDDDLPADLDVDGVKIDVEGFELSAFRGMARRLRERPPATILFEATRMATALATPEELISHLGDYGYACYGVTTRRRLRAGEPYYGGWSDNVLAVRPDVEADLRAELSLLD